jgi:predicted Zn-dependent peptidase
MSMGNFEAKGMPGVVVLFDSMPPTRPFFVLWVLAVLLVLSPRSLPAQSLSPHVEHLANGLTVMILEDHTQPLVSTQMLYRAGGRTENPGETGIAHFVEHMAYRATDRFPDTQVVSRIYAAGGEWHGYTWIDETTFFETLPAGELGLALAIEADRMAHLQIPADGIEPERGAVLTELHSYENDPASRLNDQVMATSFLEHPYRNNVIGWESDVRQLTRDQIVAFYRSHYAPANAVLAVAGDVRTGEALELIHKDFDSIPAGAPTPLPRAVEPRQLGERRVDLHGGGGGPGLGGQAWFQISYRAPAANDPDWPAFLLLQAVLSGSPGANFRQDEDPFPARPGTRLYGIGHGVTGVKTFLAATALPYVFSLSGSADASGRPEQVEAEIERRIAELRDHPMPAAEIEAARRGLLEALDLDHETAQDAAHQMAYFEGIGAFPVLHRLPELAAAVTPQDLQRVAASRLQPWQRTLGWVHPDAPLAVPAEPAMARTLPEPLQEAPGTDAMPHAPAVKKLRNGVVLIVRRLRRIPAGVLRVVVPTGAVSSLDEPVWRHTSVEVPFRAGELAQAVERALKDIKDDKDSKDAKDSEDPEEVLRLALRRLVGASPAPSAGPLTPVVVTAVGDLDEAATLRLLENAFGKLPAPRPLSPVTLKAVKAAETIPLPGRAQSELGYSVPASGGAEAWRILLYTVSHGYEGRLGKELIGRLGLLYFIDSRYDSDGKTGWISLVTGVNPDKLPEARERFAGLLGRLRQEPPTDAEIEEAKQHLIGRRITAPMSNEQLSAAYAREWIEQGRLLTDAEYARRVRTVSRAQVLALVPRFLEGVTVVVDVSGR